MENSKFKEVFAKYLGGEQVRYKEEAMGYGMEYVYLNSFYIYTVSRFQEVFEDMEPEFTEEQIEQGKAYMEKGFGHPYLDKALNIVNCWDDFSPTSEADIMEVIQRALSLPFEVAVLEPPTPPKVDCLNDLLIKYFGMGFPTPDSEDCPSYRRLVTLLHELWDITGNSTQELLEDLDALVSGDF